ncbi:carboxypeptidase-like regulatory domain-containing protein [Flavobacterium sp. LMO8]|uniref:carboxypeptidase-like regulatory domain-containing protein n=1 Tax=Flavobacterium sp. LMO8 TaxID=2654244 RepID=UPI00129160B7|nr:carboxypeptidase-like regulatory domain-containing protein [Flavobacterium sp. LMO8]MQP24984.1 carboxypeptidase-like regulatory domain-containing protein [Flavobacterium sp. LMO8]
MYKFVVLFFISFSLSAQIRGVVNDSISGEPIPFVNIWVENETIGTTSEADGTFFLEASKGKNIVVSVLGYERKILKGSEISVVHLKPMAYDLKEVVILNKKQTKKVEIGDVENAIFQSFDNGPKIEAKFFPYQSSYSKTKFIKEVTIFTDSRIDNTTIKLHFYSVDENGFPGEELLNKDYIVTLKKGVIKHRFNISQFDLVFPEKGMFVAYEKLLIESNKTGIKYQPYVLYNYVERDFFYTYAYGKWSKQLGNNSEKISINEPSINLILSN